MPIVTELCLILTFKSHASLFIADFPALQK